MFDKTKALGSVAAALILACGMFAQTGSALPAGVSEVDRQEAATVTGGCDYYSWVRPPYYHGCGGSAKSMPTTTYCPDSPVLFWNYGLPIGNYGTPCDSTCYECGAPCGTQDALPGCNY